MTVNKLLRDWKKSYLEREMNSQGWKLFSNEKLSQSTLGSAVIEIGYKCYDFAEYKDITKEDVVEHYSKFKKEYLVVDEAFNSNAELMSNCVAVYVKA